MLVDREPALWIECQSVGSGLGIFSDVNTFITALLAKHRKLAVGLVFVDGVVIGIAKEQVAAVAHPDRTLSELETFGELMDLGVSRDNLVNGRIQSNHLDIRLTRHAGERHNSAFVEIELRKAHPDVVG